MEPLRWLRRTTARRNLLLLACFFGALLGVILLHSALYDGWRHLYFIYPAFVLLAAQGRRAVWQAWQRSYANQWTLRGAGVGLLLVALALGMARVAWRMVAEHPFQYAYFSVLSGKVIEQNFERDY